MTRLVTVVLVLAGLASVAVAQDTVDAPPRGTEVARRNDAPGAATEATSVLDQLLTPTERAALREKAPAAAVVPAWPADVEKAYWERELAEQKYWKEYWPRRATTFTQQHDSGVVLFWLVVAMSAIGLAMAAYQFAKDKPSEGQTAVHTVEISRDGLKLSSSFAGIVVLAMSLSFLYLYLVHVYPINFVDPAPSNGANTHQ